MAGLTMQQLIGTYLLPSSRIKKIFGSKELWISIGFTMFLLIFEAGLSELDEVAYFTDYFYGSLSVVETFKYIALVTVVTASSTLVIIFIWASLTSNHWFRVIYFCIFTLAILYEYGFMGSFNRFSTAEDISIALLFADFTIWADSIFAYFNMFSLVSIALFAFLLVRVKAYRKNGITVFGSTLMVFFCFYSMLFPFINGVIPTISVSAFFRSLTFFSWSLTTDYYGPRDTIQYRANALPKNNIIFIVDESVRADHFSLNGYERPTTPYLSELQASGLLHNWGIGVSGGTCSKTSNILLLTGVTKLPDTEDRVKRNPSVFQYAQAMGYKTYYFDGWLNAYWNGTRDDLNYIDNWWHADYFETDPPYDTDFNIAKTTANIVSESAGNFIWINKRGVHFHYNNNFPEDKALWTPIMTTDSVKLFL